MSDSTEYRKPLTDSPHDQKLRREVHPPGWTPPTPEERYHLVVIGAGTAGLVTAAIATSLGAKVALVERSLMGGDCLNVGCVPSKGVIAAARAWQQARTAAERFGGPKTTGTGEFARAMERMRRIRADIAEVDGARRFRDLGVDVFLGQGRFVARDAVEVDGRRLEFRRAVIATGGRARVLPIEGLEAAGYLTNETIFNLQSLPRRLAVLGGGPIGCELGQAFARLGSEVTIIDRGDALLGREDPDAAAIVQASLERDGVTLALGSEVSAVHRVDDARRLTLVSAKRDGAEDAGDAKASRREIDVDHLLLAVGRVPNVEDLGLEAAGVRSDASRGIEVDDRMQTSNRAVFAIGDVASKYKFTHVADAQARLVVRNALFYGRGKASDLVVPWCTYTSPELAHVGLSKRDAEDAGHEVEELTVEMADNDRARLEGETEGFLRLRLAKGSDRILGGTLVAERAGDLLGPLTLAVTQKIGLSDFSDTIFPYPTQAEIYRRAGDQFGRRRLTPLVERAFGTWFRLT